MRFTSGESLTVAMLESEGSGEDGEEAKEGGESSVKGQEGQRPGSERPAYPWPAPAPSVPFRRPPRPRTDEARGARQRRRPHAHGLARAMDQELTSVLVTLEGQFEVKSEVFEVKLLLPLSPFFPSPAASARDSLNC